MTVIASAHFIRKSVRIEPVEMCTDSCASTSSARTLAWINPCRINRVKKCQAGFTLIELIMTMVIVGILAAVVAPRFFDNNVFQERGAADQVKAALRYGQKVAIAQRSTVNVVITAAASSDCGTRLTGGNVNCVISNSVAVVPANPTVTFNALGQRTLGTGSITVGSSPAITIEAETGYVH